MHGILKSRIITSGIGVRLYITGHSPNLEEDACKLGRSGNLRDVIRHIEQRPRHPWRGKLIWGIISC